MKVNFSILLLLVIVHTSAYSSAVLTNDKLSIIVTPPSNYNIKDTVHLVGNFNNWALSGSEAYLLNYVEGKLVTTIPDNHKNLFFGFVRNSDWQSIPSQKTGNALCIFLHQNNAEVNQIKVDIPAWKDEVNSEVALQTIVGDIKHFKDFNMPELSRTGDIWIYLPPLYEENEKKKYPVLYMLDGQNVFDKSTSYSDEWRVDESLESLISQGGLSEMIVVAIANGPRRWQEYNPWNYKSWDKKVEEVGEGDKTIAFIKNSLKPIIDKNYRTKVDNTSTGLAGSSLGGLMALYGAMEYSDVFGFIAAFSPSLAVENMSGNNVLFEALKNQKKMNSVKIYVDMGKVEYGTYKKVEFLQQLLFESGVSEKNLKLVKDNLGRHCELDWSRRFPDAVTWLFTE